MEEVFEPLVRGVRGVASPCAAGACIHFVATGLINSGRRGAGLSPGLPKLAVSNLKALARIARRWWSATSGLPCGGVGMICSGHGRALIQGCMQRVFGFLTDISRKQARDAFYGASYLINHGRV